MNVLILNAGSSSLKFQVIATDLERMERNADARLCRGLVDGIGGECKVTVQGGAGQRVKSTATLPDIHAAIDHVLQWLRSAGDVIPELHGLGDIHAVGHRVVHGGELFKQSVLIDGQVLKGIEDCIELAPLHNPGNVQGIEAARKILGEHVPQVAVFDTAFHASIPEHAYLYAIPYHLYTRHRIRRYGFHGTSHRYVSERYRALRQISRAETHVITLHLGNGCSAAAIRAGSPVDTSMGMTPLEGLVMGTRSGDLDPAIVNFIATKEKMSSEEVETLLNTQSGLLGISGFTNDMRTLQTEAERGNRMARLAIEMFCYRVRKYIGAYLACMEGADAVVFTGGIGENSAAVRAAIGSGLEWAGLRIDAERNAKAIGVEAEISAENEDTKSTLRAYVIPTDEELLIAHDTVRVVEGMKSKAEPDA